MIIENLGPSRAMVDGFLTSTISVAIYNTQVQNLTFNLLQEKIMFLNHVSLFIHEKSVGGDAD